MKNNLTIIILAIVALLASPSDAALEQSNTGLQIYLPRSVSIKGNLPNLGQVAIIQGEESLVAIAEKIGMGRISVPGQKLIINRLTLLSRLACNGISASQVTLIGAKEITLTQKHDIIKSEFFAEKALEFLKTNLPDDSICQFSSIVQPKELLLAGSNEDIKTKLSFVRTNSKNLAKIRVSLSSQGKELGSRDITFSLKFNAHRLVTKVDIPYGTTVSAENIKLEKIVSNYPDTAGSAELLFSQIAAKATKGPKTKPSNLIAKRILPAGTVIRPGMIGVPKPQVILKRNQNVVIKIDKFGLVIMTTGKAMQDGRSGECIKVQNVDSKRIIMARVHEDGTVEPVL